RARALTEIEVENALRHHVIHRPQSSNQMDSFHASEEEWDFVTTIMEGCCHPRSGQQNDSFVLRTSIYYAFDEYAKLIKKENERRNGKHLPSLPVRTYKTFSGMMRTGYAMQRDSGDYTWAACPYCVRAKEIPVEIS